MKYKIMLAALTTIIAARMYSQDLSALNYQPYFSAVIVRNIDTSARWYKSVFSLKIKNEINDAANGFKVTILESPAFLLELLELKGVLVRKEILDNLQGNKQIQGHFKIGFKLADMDAFLKHLAFLKINVPQVWTDSTTKKRNFLINDPDGNLIQCFN